MRLSLQILPVLKRAKTGMTIITAVMVRPIHVQMESSPVRQLHAIVTRNFKLQFVASFMCCKFVGYLLRFCRKFVERVHIEIYDGLYLSIGVPRGASRTRIW